MKTASSRGKVGCREDGQLIDQTASSLLIYSDRKSIKFFSLISPPLLSCCYSLSMPDSDPLSLFSSPFVTYLQKRMWEQYMGEFYTGIHL